PPTPRIPKETALKRLALALASAALMLTGTMVALAQTPAQQESRSYRLGITNPKTSATTASAPPYSDWKSLGITLGIPLASTAVCDTNIVCGLAMAGFSPFIGGNVVGDPMPFISTSISTFVASALACGGNLGCSIFASLLLEPQV